MKAPARFLVEKCLTSPHDPEQAVLTGIKKLAVQAPEFLARTREAIHATTLLTNVAIERNGAKTGLITTKGFRDILEIGREVRYDLYDLFIRFPIPLVPRRLRIGVAERVLADGSVHIPLNEMELREALRGFRKEDVEAIGILLPSCLPQPGARTPRCRNRRGGNAICCGFLVACRAPGAQRI